MPASKFKEPDLTCYSGRVAARMRELRIRSGLSAEDVIERMGRFGYEVPLRTYYGWEAGESGPRLNALPAFAKALKLGSVKKVFPAR